MNFDSIIDCWLYFAASFLIVRIVHVMYRHGSWSGLYFADSTGRILLILRYTVRKVVSMVAAAHGKPYNSNPHGLCSDEAIALAYTLAKGICNGECR